jgi:DHA2 family multidrug resistance protein-like MFS transporter
VSLPDADIHSAPDGLAPPARYKAIAVIMLGIALAVLDGSIVNLALPGISRDLNSAASQSILVVNAYQVATLAMLLPCAAFGDRFGYRRVYLVGVAVFTAASAACLLSSSMRMLIAARAVQGLGAAGIMGVNAALVRLTYPTSMLGRGIALNSVVVATASVAGPSLAAAILSLASWPWLFALNIPLGLLLLRLGRRNLPSNIAPAQPHPALHGVDIALNVLFFSLMFIGLNSLSGGVGHFAPLAPVAVGWWALGLAIAFGAVYFRRQRDQAMPLLPVDLLRIPVFALSMLTSVSAFAAQTLAFVSLPFLMLDAWHLSPLHAGLVITAWPCGVVAVAPLAGRLIGRFHGGLLGGIGLAILCTGLALLALMAHQATTVDVAWRLLLCGMGFGLFQSPNNHTIVTSAPLRRAGAASGMLGTARLTGQSLGAVLLALIFALAGTSDGSGPRLALGLAALFAAASALFSLARMRRP